MLDSCRLLSQLNFEVVIAKIMFDNFEMEVCLLDAKTNCEIIHED